MIREDTTPYFDRFRKALASAVPFEISDDVGTMASIIAGSDATKLESVLPFCRLPFPSVWMEWRGTSERFRNPDKHPAPGTTIPDRFGVLCEKLAREQTAMVSFAWGFKREGFQVCPFAAMADWREQPTMAFDTWSVTKKQDVFDVYRSDPRFKHNTDEQLWKLAQRGAVTPNLHMGLWWEHVKAGIISNRHMQEWADDMAGETPFAEALLAILNAKNLAAVHPDTTDLTKLNRARAKRGKPPMLQFRKVTVSLSRSATARASQRGDGAMPLHTVRGHFKVRKSGIYWWSPYWRGDASVGVVSRTGYTVKP